MRLLFQDNGPGLGLWRKYNSNAGLGSKRIEPRGSQNNVRGHTLFFVLEGVLHGKLKATTWRNGFRRLAEVGGAEPTHGDTEV